MTGIYSDNIGVGTVPSTPDLDNRLKSQRRSVETVEQAMSVCGGLVSENRDRVDMAGAIAEKIDAITPPYSPAELAEKGQGWQSNVATGVISSITERITPRLLIRVKSSRYLTASSLPSSYPDFTTKTAAYRKAVTDLIRGWRKFNVFWPNMIREMSEYGYCFAYYTDALEWRPKLARMDRAFIPNGTEQGEPPQFFMAKEYYRVNELWDMISDRNAAEEAGFEIDSVVEAINKAAPIFLPDANSEETNARQYEDLQRQVVTSYGYAEGSNTVEVWHLFTTEYDGTVSQWMLAPNNNSKLLFRADSRYESMDDVVVVMPFQIGDGTVHGSMGIGKMVYDLAAEVEKNRNSTIDGFRNRTRWCIEITDNSDVPDANLIVNDYGAFLRNGKFAGNTGMMPENVQAAIALDDFLRRLMEQKIGVYLFEPLVQPNPRTATEAQIIALESEELKNSVLDNFLSSNARLIALMSRRMMSKYSDDPKAMAARESLLEIMSEDELQFLIDNTPTQTIVDLTDAENARIAAWLASKKGNPFYNQREIERLEGALIVPLEIVEQVMLPVPDQTDLAEQTRLQLMEIDMMKDKTPMPVSPRDNHLIHMEILIGQTNPETGENMGPIYQSINSGDLETAILLQEHLISHASFIEDQMGEGLNQFKEFVAATQRRVEEVQREFAEASASSGMPPVPFVTG